MEFVNSVMYYYKPINQSYTQKNVMKAIVEMLLKNGSAENPYVTFMYTSLIENKHEVLQLDYNEKKTSIEESVIYKILQLSYTVDNTMYWTSRRVCMSWISLTGFIFCPKLTCDVLDKQGRLDETLTNLIRWNSEYTTYFSIKVSLYINIKWIKILVHGVCFYKLASSNFIACSCES